MAGIELKNIYKAFGKNVIIEDLNLTIQDGKFTVLVGPSGCGKTTLLRIIAGIGEATSGRVLMDGVEITDLEPGKRNVAMVFQNYAIYPTMSVRENIEFGLKNKKVPAADREKLVMDVTHSVGLTEYLDRKPSTLSGGQRQRVALARAMVKNPKVFLMDEPLSNLDAKLRTAMRIELIELHEKLKTTFIYVTHDQVEAMSMADIIVLMDKGKILQEGTPSEIYNDPKSVFIAQFIGSPAMNIIEARDGIQVGYRPERITLSTGAAQNIIGKGVVFTREMLGHETVYKVQMAEDAVMVRTTDDSFLIGDNVNVSVAPQHIYFFGPDGNRIREDDQQRFALVKSIVGEMYHEAG
ncbi:MAG: ABC transporter ATP-binding protein [Christensenellales bacterium]